MRNDEKQKDDSQSNDDLEPPDESQPQSGDQEVKVRDKRGERPDNLRRRSEWFRKRTGEE